MPTEHIKELYSARLTLLDMVNTLDSVSQGITPEKAEEIYVAEVVERLHMTIAECGNRILKIEHEILEYWGLPNMAIVQCIHKVD